jgi:hypothetical protein
MDNNNTVPIDNSTNELIATTNPSSSASLSPMFILEDATSVNITGGHLIDGNTSSSFQSLSVVYLTSMSLSSWPLMNANYGDINEIMA